MPHKKTKKIRLTKSVPPKNQEPSGEVQFNIGETEKEQIINQLKV